MALEDEDGETLAHTISQADFLADRMALLGKRERHRQARLRRFKNMTDWGGKQRAPVSNSVVCYLKEWVVRAALKIKDLNLGMEWLHSYNPEDFLKVLAD